MSDLHETAERQAAVIRETIAVMRATARSIEDTAPLTSVELAEQADELAEACGLAEKKDGEG